MRGILLAAAGLLLATAAVQAQAATQPKAHEHVATALLYRSDAEARMEPVATYPVLPKASPLLPYPASLGYNPRRTYRPHIEVIERTYVIVEDSLPVPPFQAVPGRPPRGRKW